MIPSILETRHGIELEAEQTTEHQRWYMQLMMFDNYCKTLSSHAEIKKNNRKLFLRQCIVSYQSAWLDPISIYAIYDYWLPRRLVVI